jgi:hypothetical protein
MHCCEPQSLLFPHALPFGQVGAHTGAAHVPLVHNPEPQSWLPTHGSPSAQGGEHCFVPGHMDGPQGVQESPHLYSLWKTALGEKWYAALTPHLSAARLMVHEEISNCTPTISGHGCPLSGLQ